LLSASAVLCFAAWVSIMQLFTFHLGLISRGLTTYEFIVAQRQKQKAFDAANKEPLTWAQKQQQWIQTNAPCLAVCDVCQVSPPAGSSTRGPTAAITVALSGRRRPGLGFWKRGAKPQHANTGTAFQERAPCSPGSSGGSKPQDLEAAAAPGAPSEEVRADDALAEPSAVHIVAASAVQQDGFLPESSPSPAPAPAALTAPGERSEPPRGRVQLAPIASAPTLPSSCSLETGGTQPGTREGP